MMLLRRAKVLKVAMVVANIKARPRVALKAVMMAILRIIPLMVKATAVVTKDTVAPLRAVVQVVVKESPPNISKKQKGPENFRAFLFYE